MLETLGRALTWFTVFRVYPKVFSFLIQTVVWLVISAIVVVSSSLIFYMLFQEV